VNEAPVAGYQRDVGRRTDMRLINNLWSDKYSKGTTLRRFYGLHDGRTEAVA
jgi:hypothetical protein